MYAESCFQEWMKGMLAGSAFYGGIRTAIQPGGAAMLGIQTGPPSAYYLYRRRTIAEPAVAGTFYHAGASDIRKLAPGSMLKLIREPGNRFDRNAVQVMSRCGARLGYVPRFAASLVAPEMDRGNRVFARVRSSNPDKKQIVISIYTYLPSMAEAG